MIRASNVSSGKTGWEDREPRVSNKENVGHRSGELLETLIIEMALYCGVGGAIISRMTAELRRTLASLG